MLMVLSPVSMATNGNNPEHAQLVLGCYDMENLKCVLCIINIVLVL